MAHALTYELGTRRGLGALARARKAFADYRLYRRTVAESATLSNRELNDLGISRFAIRQIAHDSVYGA